MRGEIWWWMGVPPSSVPYRDSRSVAEWLGGMGPYRGAMWRLASHAARKADRTRFGDTHNSISLKKRGRRTQQRIPFMPTSSAAEHLPQWTATTCSRRISARVS